MSREIKRVAIKFQSNSTKDISDIEIKRDEKNFQDAREAGCDNEKMAGLFWISLPYSLVGNWRGAFAKYVGKRRNTRGCKTKEKKSKFF